jgi:hypothetical protein
MRLTGFIAVAVFTSLTVPSRGQVPVVSGLALQQIEARDFEAPAAIVFPAVMTVLQDGGFRILTADRDTGLITAAGSTESHMTWLPFFGFGMKKRIPVVSAFIEQRGPNLTRARLNFVMSTAKSTQSFTDDRPVTDPQTYRDAFERIEKEIFVRQAMAAPTPPAPPAEKATATLPRYAASVTLIASAPHASMPVAQPAPPSVSSEKKPPSSAQAPPPDPARQAVEEQVPPPVAAPKVGIPSTQTQWRQASYAPGISVGFVDANSIARHAGTVRFRELLYYLPDQGTDHFIALREVDCGLRSFSDATVTYYFGTTLVRTVSDQSDPIIPARGTVTDEIIRAACDPRRLGKAFSDPNMAARLFFEETRR